MIMFSIVAFIALGLPATGAEQPETPHLAFVSEYIRQLGEMERIRAQGDKELTAAREGKGNTLSSTIHTCTAIQLELRADIAMLKGMTLKPPLESVPDELARFYQQKIELHERLIEISTAFVGGPKPNVDYDKLAAEAPKIRAGLDFIDNALLSDVTPLVFASLIDERPDSKSHVSHLIITRAEKATLLDQLARRFGPKLDQKNQSLTVGAAQLLKAYLLKDFKCADEPWE